MSLSAVLATMVVAAVAATMPGPPALLALADEMRITQQISHWCPVHLGSGRPRAFAVAVPSPTGGGRYLVLGLRGQAIELGSFVGPADLACYTPSQARRLHGALRETETMHGSIEPAGRSTVICGFVEPTSAVCWQYLPSVRAFVKVGQWIT